MTRKPRQRTCECGCGRKFTPSSSFVTWATIECAIAVLKIRQAKKERKELKARKEAIKRPKELNEEAQAAINAFRRYEDISKGYGCICCDKPFEPDKPGGSVDAGHYLSRGSHPNLAFVEMNINAQRKNCNRPGGTTAAKFREGMIRRYGLEAVEALEADKTPRRYRDDDYRRIRDEYRAKLSHLKKQERNKP